MGDPAILLIISLAFIAVGLWLFWPDRGIFWRWQRARQMTERVLIEDALKHIYAYEEQERHPTLESLAGALRTSDDTVADLLTEMQVRELIMLTAGNMQLTPRGRDYALYIIRAHRLWESYLANKTGYDAADWHSQSERREHELSPTETDALAAELGHPRFDPHGDPIPTADGQIVDLHDQQPLAKLRLNQPARIVHLEDEPQTIYAQLLAEGLHLGMQVIVTERTAQRIRFWGDGDEHVLAPLLANNVSITPIRRDEMESGPFQSLDSLIAGESAQVTRISPRLQGAERRRLLDLGLLPGTVITAEMVSPSGDPTAYRVRGALIGLRKEQAAMIQIRPEAENPAAEPIGMLNGTKSVSQKGELA
ncbi:MAG: metal-dependent transcriptional regulator [Caldilineaceae bacterium]